mgnify:FL=1
MKSRIIRIVPFAIVCVIMAFTWVNILTTEYFATLRHQVALVLVSLNLVLFFFNYKYAILFTGLILLLATFNLLAFFPSIESSAYFIRFGSKEVYAPSIQPRSLLLLLLYLGINFKYLYASFSSKD